MITITYKQGMKKRGFRVSSRWFFERSVLSSAREVYDSQGGKLTFISVTVSLISKGLVSQRRQISIQKLLCYMILCLSKNVFLGDFKIVVD